MVPVRILIVLERYNWNIVESGIKHHNPLIALERYNWNIAESGVKHHNPLFALTSLCNIIFCWEKYSSIFVHEPFYSLYNITFKMHASSNNPI